MELFDLATNTGTIIIVMRTLCTTVPGIRSAGHCYRDLIADTLSFTHCDGYCIGTTYLQAIYVRVKCVQLGRAVTRSRFGIRSVHQLIKTLTLTHGHNKVPEVARACDLFA